MELCLDCQLFEKVRLRLKGWAARLRQAEKQYVEITWCTHGRPEPRVCRPGEVQRLMNPRLASKTGQVKEAMQRDSLHSFSLATSAVGLCA